MGDHLNKQTNKNCFANNIQKFWKRNQCHEKKHILKEICNGNICCKCILGAARPQGTRVNVQVYLFSQVYLWLSGTNVEVS